MAPLHPFAQMKHGCGGLGTLKRSHSEGSGINRYLAAGGKPGDIQEQTDFMMRRLRQIDPNIDHASQAQIAADFAKFESSGHGAGYYAAHLSVAEKIRAEMQRAQPRPLQVASAQTTQGQPDLAQGGALRMHPVAAARAAKGNNLKVSVSQDFGGSSTIQISRLPVY